VHPVVLAFPQPLNQSFPELTHYHRNAVLVDRETLTYYLQTLPMSRLRKNSDSHRFGVRPQAPQAAEKLSFALDFGWRSGSPLR